MRIAITGANGQFGQALTRRLEGAHTIIALNQPEFELDRPAAVQAIQATGADLVIHPAAYTDVDGCARNPQLAYQVNALGSWYVALGCRALGAPLVYISTNEVFSGTTDTPYHEYDEVGPINAYGRSKLAGERAVLQVLRECYIVRVAWLFGGPRNFVRTVLRLAGERSEISMVTDQVGSPTYAPDAADAIAQLITTGYYGTYHLVNEGVCSRFDLAAEILRQAGRADVRLIPIRDADFPRPSTPPRYSALSNMAGAALGLTLRPWQVALAAFLRADPA